MRQCDTARPAKAESAGIGRQRLEMERAMGIEPTAQAWEAWVLPLYDARYPSDSSTDVKQY
jgi:hypothetical protein